MKRQILEIADELSNDAITPQQAEALLLRLFVVSGSLLNEAIYLLRISQPENCSKWIEGVGDCGKVSCNFCRIEKCITELESNDR
jgi:hypothetical protein